MSEGSDNDDRFKIFVDINEALKATYEALNICDGMSIATVIGILEMVKAQVMRDFEEASVKETLKEMAMMALTPEGGIQ